MKFQINDEVVVKRNGQIVKGQVIEVKKTWFGNRYTIFFNVDMYDKGNYKYTKSAYQKYWEKNILSKLSNGESGKVGFDCPKDKNHYELDTKNFEKSPVISCGCGYKFLESCQIC